MNSQQRIGTPLPVGASIIAGTLRARMEELRAQGQVLSLEEAIAVLVPLTVEVAQRHGQGQRFYVNPSSVLLGENGVWRLAPELATRAPTLPRDKTCLAPEERGGLVGNSRATVFSVGAILYELVTGQTVGPGMRRPTELDPSLPPALEGILAKALIAHPDHRPDDLNALAQALYHLAPANTEAPPPADESRLDGVDVDVSMSLMPPAARGGGGVPLSPYDMIVNHHVVERPKDSQTEELSALKARLEADPRPRYVVVKDGMDHGPFSSVELLQQIASHTFVEGDYIRDTFTKQERMIRDWDEFAPFAEHARIHRDIKAEKAALERTVVQERQSTASKAILAIALLGGLLVVGGVWFLAQRGIRSDRVAVQEDKVSSVETDAGLSGPAGGRARAGGVVGHSGGFPQLGGGMSCEQARSKYVEAYNLGSNGQKIPADLSAGHYGKVLNRGSYLVGCGVPNSMSVTICAAVQNGRAVGVTVTTNPRNGGVANCIASKVRGLPFPSHPRLDVTTTTFAAQ